MRYRAPWLKTAPVTAAWAGVRPGASQVDRGDGKAILADLTAGLAACDDTLRCLVRRLREPGCEVDARHAAQSLPIAKL